MRAVGTCHRLPLLLQPLWMSSARLPALRHARAQWIVD